MSITYSGQFSAATNISHAVGDDTGNGVCLVDITPAFRYYSLNTATLVCSATSSITPIQISLITPATACVVGSGSNVEFYAISNGFRTTVASPANIKYNSPVNSGKNQQIDSDQSVGIAFATNANNNTVTRITTSPSFSASSVTIPDAYTSNGCPITTIVSMGCGTQKWLLGTTNGNIIEINSAGTVVDRMDIFSQESGQYLVQPTLSQVNGEIYYIGVDNNLVLVETQTLRLLIDWSSKTILKTTPNFGNSNTSSGPGQLTMSNSVSGTVLQSNINSSNPASSVIYETDFSIRRIKTTGTLLSDYSGGGNAVGILPNNRTFFAILSGSKIIYGAWAPNQSTTIRNVSVTGNPQARLIVIDDTGGTGTATVVLDTVFQSPGNYRVKTGRTFMEIIKVGQGANAQWDVSRYST